MQTGIEVVSLVEDMPCVWASYQKQHPLRATLPGGEESIPDDGTNSGGKTDR